MLALNGDNLSSRFAMGEPSSSLLLIYTFRRGELISVAGWVLFSFLLRHSWSKRDSISSSGSDIRRASRPVSRLIPELCLEWIIKSLSGGLAIGYIYGETDVRMAESAVML